MSIFKAREWWLWEAEAGVAGEAGVANSEGPEEEDGGTNALRMLSVDLASFPHTMGHQAEVIVAGSLGGMLRLFLPYPHEDEGAQKTSGASNLLIETQLAEPVLQVAVGNLSSSGKDPEIAVLHPRLLSIYSLQSQKGNRTQGLENYQLNLQYQHKLSRSAFCLVVGPFGGAKKDFLCVQSMDGTVNIFEQESYSFSRFLPGSLLPGPIAYVKRTNSFITCSSAFQLESYRYQSLAVAGDQNSQARKDDDFVSGKKVSADWNLGLGEEVTSLQVIDSAKKDMPSTIIVLGSRTICSLLDTGVVIFMKKLDFMPFSLTSYVSDISENKIMSLVASDTQTLLVYENTSLKWAAQLPFRPIAVKRGSFKKDTQTTELVKNLLVLVSASGDIMISYLGTDPAVFSAPAHMTRDVNYEETDKEFSQLTQQIKAATANADSAPKTDKVQGELTLSATVSTQLDRCFYETLVQVDGETGLPMAKVMVQLRTNTPLSKVRIALSIDHPLMLSKTTHTINSLTESETVESHAYLHGTSIPHSLQVSVCASYVSNQGMPTVQKEMVSLPLKLILKPCPPFKDADYKVTISTNKPAVSLLDLFPEFVLDNSMANAVGFQFLGSGPFVTVLSSKTSQRYRLQSDNLPSLWLLTKEIEERLHRMHPPQEGSNGLHCSYSSSLPMHEYFSEIETHFHRRNKMHQLLAQLAQRTSQFRSIERRLLSRFKDKTPTPLTNLDTLLEGTYRQILLVTEALEECTVEVAHSSCNLSCITNLLLLLARLSTNMSQEEADKLKAALSPIVHPVQEQGWEETTDAALTYLLRTSLAKPGKENQGATPITLDPPKDTTRLKKHISSVMDRIAKGGRILDTKSKVTVPALFGTDDDTMSMVGGGDERDDDVGGGGGGGGGGEDDVAVRPVGSQFGETGERMRSARNQRRRPGSAMSMANAKLETRREDATSAPNAENNAKSDEKLPADDIEGLDETADVNDLLGW